MSNCHSAQAEYSDHDFIEGICKDCGEVSKRDVKALAGQVKILEAKVTELVGRNLKLANQIVGYGDRMQTMIGGVVKDAKAEALREAAEYFDKRATMLIEGHPVKHEDRRGAYTAEAQHAAITLTRMADNLEAS